MPQFKNLPFALIAATGYLVANLTLTFQGLIEGHSLFPSKQDLLTLDPSSWQSLAGLLWVIVSLTTYLIQKYPHGAILINAVLQLFANTALLISGYTQEAFLVHAIGFIPAFLAIALMFQGNRVSDKQSFYTRYPVACAAFLFILVVPPLLYNAILSQDWTLACCICIWLVSHIFFGLTDQNFQKKLFG
jgi:hypothetical protein